MKDDVRLQTKLSAEDKAALQHLERDVKRLLVKYNIRAVCLIAQPEYLPNSGFSLIALSDAVPSAPHQLLIDSLVQLQHGCERLATGIGIELNELRAALDATKTKHD